MITLLLSIALIIINLLLISKMPIILFQYTYDDLNEIINTKYNDLSVAEKLVYDKDSLRETIAKAKNLKSASITLTIFFIIISIILIYIIYRLEKNRQEIDKGEINYHQKLTFISQNVENNILQINVDIRNTLKETKFFCIEDFSVEIENKKQQIAYLLDKNKQKRSLPVNIHRVYKLCMPIKQKSNLNTMHVYYKGHELELGKDLKIKNDEIINDNSPIENQDK